MGKTIVKNGKVIVEVELGEYQELLQYKLYALKQVNLLFKTHKEQIEHLKTQIEEFKNLSITDL